MVLELLADETYQSEGSPHLMRFSDLQPYIPKRVSFIDTHTSVSPPRPDNLFVCSSLQATLIIRTRPNQLTNRVGKTFGWSPNLFLLSLCRDHSVMFLSIKTISLDTT